MPTGIQSARRSTSSLPVGPANANNDLWSASCASGGSDRRMRHAECHRARLEPKHRVGNPESRKFVLLLGARRPMSQAAGMTTGGIEGRGVETGRFRCDDGRGRGQMRRIREVQQMQRLGLSRADRPAVRSHIRQRGRGPSPCPNPHRRNSSNRKIDSRGLWRPEHQLEYTLYSAARLSDPPRPPQRSTRCTALPTIRNAPHDGHKPRCFREKADRFS